MRPEGVRVLRRERRRALRGVPTGRRRTHSVRTERPRQRQYDMHVRIWRYVQISDRLWADRDVAA
jgi:hypothetical protein